MNNSKFGIYIFGAALIGAAAGYYYATTTKAKQLEKEYNEERMLLKSMFEEKYQKNIVEVNDSPTEVQLLDKTKKSYSMYTQYNKPNLKDLAESHITHPSEEEIEEAPEEDDDEGYDEEAEDFEIYDDENDPDSIHDPNIHETGNTSPYRVDREAFMTQNLHYEKTVLYYYRKDKTLADEYDEVMTENEQEKLIGNGWLRGLNIRRPVYIRNEAVGLDFEIRSLNSSYTVEISGKLETDAERNARIKNRKRELTIKRRQERNLKTKRSSDD